MRPSTTDPLTFSANGVSSPIPLNWRSTGEGFQVAVAVKATGDAVYKVQYTMDNIIAGETATWFDAPTSTGLESVTGGTSEIGAIAFPCMALRLAVKTAGTSGSATMTVVQAS